MKQKQKPSRGPKAIPSQLQLPGGVVLKAMPFKIVEYHQNGTPKLFELRPADVHHDMKIDGNCVLFANEVWIRAPRPGKPAP